jgi:lysophospholipase L1-like esterase
VLLGLALALAAEAALRLGGYRYAAEEVVFRFVGRDVADQPEYLVRDRRLFWRLKPGGREIGMEAAGTAVTNAAGFRGPLVAGPRMKGVPRIACLGDSVTYGVGVPFEKSYVALTGTLLEESLRRRVEMIGAGCPGYTSFQGVRLLESRILPLEPDVVTLLFGAWNEYVPAVGGDDEAKGARARLPEWADPLLDALRGLRLFMAVSHARDAMAGARADARFGRRDMREYMTGFARGRPPEGERVPPEKFRANLLAAVRTARARGVEPVLITPGVDAESRRRYPVAAFYREIVHELAAAERVRLVQAAEHLEGWEGRGTAVFADWVHPNAFGHEIIARVLAPVVAEIVREREHAGAGEPPRSRDAARARTR